MDLRALADFILVADSGGFARAERRSGQSKATLSRRIRELEADLGIRLFDRDTRALRLTEEGESLYARTRGPLIEVAEAEVALRAAGDQPHGLLRISAPLLFSELALGAIAASYLAKNPAVQLDIVSEDRVASAVVDGLDLVIRINPQPSDELVGRCFLRDRHQIVAAPALARRMETERSRVWPSVVISGRPERVWTVTGGTGIHDLRHEPVIQTPLMLTAYHAALAGAGIVRLPWAMVADDVAVGRLIRLGEDAGSDVAAWALYPSRRLASRKVTSFLDHLTTWFPECRWPTDQQPSFMPMVRASGHA